MIVIFMVHFKGIDSGEMIKKSLDYLIYVEVFSRYSISRRVGNLRNPGCNRGWDVTMTNCKVT